MLCLSLSACWRVGCGWLRQGQASANQPADRRGERCSSGARSQEDQQAVHRWKMLGGAG